MQEQILILTVTIFIGVAIFLKFKWKKESSGWKKEVKKKLQQLDLQANSKDHLHQKSAVIEADKLLDYSLRNSGYKGNTAGEMLKNANKTFDRNFYNEIWQAHKARNILVHEVNETIPSQTLTKHYKTLKKAILVLAK